MRGGNSYQITVRGGRFGFVIFRRDASHNDQGVQNDVRDLDGAIAKFDDWIRTYRWGEGPCRLRNVDTGEWMYLGVIGKAS